MSTIKLTINSKAYQISYKTGDIDRSEFKNTIRIIIYNITPITGYRYKYLFNNYISNLVESNPLV